MPTFAGNALIGQSGGPTAVINQSLVGLVEECLASAGVRDVLGARFGLAGLLREELVDLGRQRREVLEAVARTPCAALGSARKKPDRAECERALEIFRAHDVRWFFYIGGNDTAETALLLHEVARASDWELRLVHVPKTIDNDLMVTDHCPGYGSAARFVAQALMGDDQDNRSLPGIKIDVIMGRHAGWLTGAAALGRASQDDGPHLVYLPEEVFDVDAFAGQVEEVYARLGRCLVAVSEGIHDAQGRLIAQSGEVDVFGNAQLSGSGVLGDRLAALVKERLGEKRRVRADTLGYMQRSFFGVVSESDAREAREVGRAAVRLATAGEREHGSVVLLREPGEAYAVRYDLCELSEVGGKTKTVPAGMRAGPGAVDASFLEYARPLVGELPRAGRLEELSVARRL